MADSSKTLAGVLFYARERYFRHVQMAVLEVLNTYGSDPVLQFWKAYGIVMEDRLSEGMRELVVLVDKRDTLVAAPLLLIYAHKRCQTVDREAVQQLEAKVRSQRTSCGEKALYHAAVFLWLCGRHDKAREYVERMLKMAPASREGLSLRGWVDLTCGRETLVKKSIKYFEEALAGPENPKPVDAIFGKARFYLARHNFSHALEVLNSAVAGYPGFVPALLEKMKVQLALQDWEQATETAHRCLNLDANCVEATQLLALEQLAREGGRGEAAGKISDVIQLLDRFEPKNHALYYQAALPFARMSGGHTLVLQQTMTLVERAISLAPLNAEYINELAYERLISGQVREALQTYRKAFNQDETSIGSLAGIIHCQIQDGQLSEAEQQLEFLAEVQSSIGRQADLLYLGALLAQRRGKPASEVMPLLQDTVEAHFAAVKGQPFGSHYFYLINPQFLLQLAKAMMMYAPTDPAHSRSQVDPVLRKAATVLDPLTKSCPGMAETLHLLARVKFLSGDTEPAQAMLQRCIERDPASLEAHLLMAQLALHQDNIKQCSSSLEMALSSDFEVQSIPLYHLVKAQTEERRGQWAEALSSLQTSMSLITAKKTAFRPQQSRFPPLSLSEKVTVYLELANVHSQLGHQPEAAKVMQDALNEFSGTAEEVRVLVANADLALDRGDTDHALTMLRGVTEDKPYFIQAKEKMAEIYFTHRQDRKLYIACYQELAEKLPGPPTALLLGDAYMSIQEAETALQVYEAALKKNPRDGILASKIGQALVKTHSYTKAINYYEAALKLEGQNFLRSDLAELYIKLRHYDRAEKTLNAALEHQGDAFDLPVLMEDTRYLLLIAKVHRKAGFPAKALQTLNRARDTQSRVLKRVGVEQPESALVQKQLAARTASSIFLSISCQLAEHYAGVRDYESAVRYYREALLHNENHSAARLALAEMHLLRGELGASEHECVTLLRLEPTNERATVMKADLLFRKGDYNLAAQYFQEMLGRWPDHFQALSRLIELNRRAGQLSTCQPYIQQAEKVCARLAYDPGLNYCKGLYQRFQNQPTEALHSFNQARKDSQWGEKALFNMIEICLNPDNETLGGETFKPLDTDSSTSSEDQMAVHTAEKLLKEVRPRSPLSEQRVKVLQNYALLASKGRQSAELALGKFTEMVTTERDNVPALLGMATAYMILKQTPRARNQLKRIAKMQWNSQDAEEFERSWLLLADVYIQAGKYDMAVELLKKCTQHNQSCSKAWEYMGFISEKDQAYKDAASHYEKAWKYSNHTDPSIGYKLAFNYLKAKRYVDAIDICHAVLESNPNYPKIRRDILEKARLSIRA